MTDGGASRREEAGALDTEIRDVGPGDQDAVVRLFETGHTEGGAADDPGDDVRDVVSHYIDSETAWMWVADLPGTGPIGMVALEELREHAVELKRLRVDPRYRQRGVGSGLVAHALTVCRDRAYLKIVLDTYAIRAPAIQLFEKLGFQDGGERKRGERALREFYLDLYSDLGES